MNLRDWLIIIGIVIIVGILVDGYRRMRLAKKDSLKMSLEMGGDYDKSPLDEGFNPELPSGGARIVDSDLDDVDSDGVKKQLEPFLPDDIHDEVSADSYGKHDDEKIEHLVATTNKLSENQKTESVVADLNDRLEIESPLNISQPSIESETNLEKEDILIIVDCLM